MPSRIKKREKGSIFDISVSCIEFFEPTYIKKRRHPGLEVTSIIALIVSLAPTCILLLEVRDEVFALGACLEAFEAFLLDLAHAFAGEAEFHGNLVQAEGMGDANAEV